MQLEFDTFETYGYFICSLILVVMVTILIRDLTNEVPNIQVKISEFLVEPKFERRSSRICDPNKVQISVQLQNFMGIKETFLEELDIYEFMDQYIDKFCKPDYEKDTFILDEKLSRLFRMPLKYKMSYDESFEIYLPEHYKVLVNE